MVIDLDAPVSRPETPRRGRARPVALVVAGILLLALAGSAAPPEALRRVLDVDAAGTFAVTSSALFTAGLGRAPGRQAVIRRHPFGGDPTRWSAEVPQTVGRLHVIGPVLVADPAEVLITTVADQQQTTFLDLGTGTILWRTRSADIVGLTEAGALLAGAGQLRRADLRSGTTLWSRPIGTAYAFAVGGVVVTVDQVGTVTVLDAADGRRLATGELGAAPGDTARYTAAGDHLYLSRRDGSRASLSAYRLPDLRLLWRNTAAPAGDPSWCGPEHLCVTTNPGVAVLDRGTGVMRWSGQHWLAAFDSRTLGIAGPRRIAVEDDRPDPRGALLDPATGEVTATLGVVTFTDGVLLRSDTDRPGRALLLAVGPRGDVRTVGALDSIVASRCESSAAHLACPTGDGRLGVWRLPGWVSVSG